MPEEAHVSKMTNSKIVKIADVTEPVIADLLNQLSPMPEPFDVTIIVTVVVTPLPDETEVMQLSRPQHK